MARRPTSRVPLRTTDQEEIERRRQRAAKEKFTITNRFPQFPIFSNFAVHSESGMEYEVELRDLAWREVYCTCTDFRVNRLGTCKHVEAVLSHLQKEFPDTYENALSDGSPRIDIVPDKSGHALRVDRNADRLPAGLKAIFDKDHLSAAISDELVEQLRHTEDIRVSREVDVWLERRQRAAERVELRRSYEDCVRCGQAPVNETRIPLYPYQREGMLFLAFHERAWLADESGLGRGVQAIAACALLNRLDQAARVLVVTPSALIPEWDKQIKEYSGLSSGRLESMDDAVFLLGTYEEVARRISDINDQLRPEIVILDEARRIKDWNTPLAMRIKQLQSRFAFVLAPLPRETKADEIYSLMSFVDPEVLGPLFRFNREFYETDAEGRPTGRVHMERLLERISSCVLRRTRAQVASQIPARVESLYLLDLSPGLRSTYARHERNAKALLRKARQQSLTDTEHDELEKQMGILRLLCNGIHEDEVQDASKLKELDALLHECLGDSGGKVVIFSEWEKMLQGAARMCEEMGYQTILFDGKLSTQQRTKAVKAFHADPDCRVFLTTDALGSPLSVPPESTVILLDVPWTSRRLEDRLGRVSPADRAGVLRIIHLVTKDTIEERLFRRLRTGGKVKALSARSAAQAGHMGDLFEITEPEKTPAQRLLNDTKAREEWAEAKRRWRLARILFEEGFAAESTEALHKAALHAAICLAYRNRWEIPQDPQVLSQAPYAGEIGPCALGLWRWFQSPEEQLVFGLEAMKVLLRHQPEESDTL